MMDELNLEDLNVLLTDQDVIVEDLIKKKVSEDVIRKIEKSLNRIWRILYNLKYHDSTCIEDIKEMEDEESKVESLLKKVEGYENTWFTWDHDEAKTYVE